SIPLVFAVAMKIFSDGGDINSITDQNVLMTTLDSNFTLFLMLLAYAIGLFAIFLVIRFLHKQSMVALTTSRKKIDWERIFFGFGLIAITMIIITALDYYNN